MKKKLADWSPKLLQNLYASVLERLASDNLNQREIKAFTKNNIPHFFVRLPPATLPNLQ